MIVRSITPNPPALAPRPAQPSLGALPFGLSWPVLIAIVAGLIIAIRWARKEAKRQRRRRMILARLGGR